MIARRRQDAGRAPSADGTHPLALVRTLRALRAEDCDAIVAEADSYAAANGWTTDRHIASARGKTWNEDSHVSTTSNIRQTDSDACEFAALGIQEHSAAVSLAMMDKHRSQA